MVTPTKSFLQRSGNIVHQIHLQNLFIRTKSGALIFFLIIQFRKRENKINQNRYSVNALGIQFSYLIN